MDDLVTEGQKIQMLVTTSNLTENHHLATLLCQNPSPSLAVGCLGKCCCNSALVTRSRRSPARTVRSPNRTRHAPQKPPRVEKDMGHGGGGQEHERHGVSAAVRDRPLGFGSLAAELQTQCFLMALPRDIRLVGRLPRKGGVDNPNGESSTCVARDTSVLGLRSGTNIGRSTPVMSLAAQPRGSKPQIPTEASRVDTAGRWR